MELALEILDGLLATSTDFLPPVQGHTALVDSANSAFTLLECECGTLGPAPAMVQDGYQVQCKVCGAVWQCDVIEPECRAIAFYVGDDFTN